MITRHVIRPHAVEDFDEQLDYYETEAGLELAPRFFHAVEDLRMSEEALVLVSELDRLEEAEATAAVHEGIEQIKRGEGIPWPKAKKKLLKKHGF